MNPGDGLGDSSPKLSPRFSNMAADVRSPKDSLLSSVRIDRHFAVLPSFPVPGRVSSRRLGSPNTYKQYRVRFSVLLLSLLYINLFDHSLRLPPLTKYMKTRSTDRLFAWQEPLGGH